jgi:limonene-1,2-epoxide hydrolase
MNRERELREQWESLHMVVHRQEQLARDKAEGAINERLEGMNEVRAQINEERGSYATRVEMDAVNSSTDGRLKTLERKDANTDGKFWVFGAIVILVNLAMYFLGKK